VRFDAIYAGPKLTSRELDSYCQEHGLVLPVSLTQQLLDQNGGAPTADVLARLPDGDETDMFTLFGVKMRHESSELAWNVEVFAGRIPEGLVPFASDSGDNLFLVGHDDFDWFWDHEQEGMPEAAEPLNAPLDDFLAALTC
jgi:hypothetical protein